MERPESQDHLVNQALLDQWDLKEKREIPVPVEQRVTKDGQVSPGVKECLDLRATAEISDNPVPLDHLGHREKLDSKDHQAVTVTPDLLGPQEHLDHVDRKGTMDQMDLKDHLGHLADQDLPVMLQFSQAASTIIK